VVRADTASRDAVRRSIPDLDSVSLEQGTQILRASAIGQFQKAAQDMEAALNQARQSFLEAEKSQSDAGRQAALKRLQQIQAGQTDKLRQIAINSQAQIAALQHIKKDAP
jgi:Sec-independent protein translocase protein TatA